jgi:hypothetical protein
VPDIDIQSWVAARATWQREVGVESSRARVACIALACTAALRAAQLACAVFPVSTAVFLQLQSVDTLLLCVTVVLFLRWLAHAVKLASAMSSAPLQWTGSGAVWSFFIPIISLWRPFYVLRDLRDHLAPNGVPEPAPRPRLDGSGGYRHVEMDSAPPPRALVNASIGAWWGFFISARVLGVGIVATNYGVVAELLSITSAILGVLVVRSIDGRVTERFRRLHHASDDELAAWNIRATADLR